MFTDQLAEQQDTDQPVQPTVVKQLDERVEQSDVASKPAMTIVMEKVAPGILIQPGTPVAKPPFDSMELEEPADTCQSDTSSVVSEDMSVALSTDDEEEALSPEIPVVRGTRILPDNAELDGKQV